MPTVVMTHGAFCGGWAFESFRRPFEAAGYAVLAPDLPGHEPGGSVAGLSMRDYADALARVCEGVAEPPILVGHSMGGLVCQMAARRVGAQALVLLAPSPPWGVMGASLEESLTALGVPFLDPFWSGSVPVSRDVARHTSLDRVERGAREAILARMRSESGRAIREVLNWWMDPFMTTGVGPGSLPCPSLVLGGDRDSVHSAATMRQTAARIGGRFRLLPGMSHWLVAERGWEEVAEIALAFLDEVATADVRPGSTASSPRGR